MYIRKGKFKKLSLGIGIFLLLFMPVKAEEVSKWSSGTVGRSEEDQEILETSGTQEMNKVFDQYIGYYSADDGSSVVISKGSGQYNISIDIVRLASIDNGISEYVADEQMLFNAIDDSDNPIGGLIKWRNNYEDMDLLITDSTWDFLPNGTVLSFKKKNDSDTLENDAFNEVWYKTYNSFVDMNGSPIRVDWYDDGTFSVIDVDYEIFTGSAYDYKKDSEGTFIYKSYIDDTVLRYYPEKGNCVSIKYRGCNSFYYYPILENDNDVSVIYPEHEEFFEDWYAINNTYMDYCADEIVTFEYYDDGSITGTINDTTLIHISKYDYEINENNGYVYTSTFPSAKLIYYPYHGNQIEYICEGITTYYYPIATYLFE